MAQILCGRFDPLKAASAILWLGTRSSDAACASFRLADTPPQQSWNHLERTVFPRVDIGSTSSSSPPTRPSLLVFVAKSGGGKRSAPFGYGALNGMRDIIVPSRSGWRPFLNQVDAISGDSSKEMGGLFDVPGLVSGAQIDSYNFGTLTVVSQQIQIITKRLQKARGAEGPVIDGTQCDDVKSEPIHVLLAGLPENPGRKRLLAIPTGLTLTRDGVDRLVHAGCDGITKSAELRDFLDEDPPVPLPAKAGEANRSATVSSPSVDCYHVRLSHAVVYRWLHRSLSMLSLLPPTSPFTLEDMLTPPPDQQVGSA